MRYLGVDPATDENILWIFTAFKDRTFFTSKRFPTGSMERNRQEEPLPPWFSQYVKDKVVTECLKQVHGCVENWLEAAKK